MTANLRSGAQLTSDQDGPEIWSWITSHRTVFAPQTHYEMDENIRQPEIYSKKIKPSLKKVASIEDLTGIDDDNDNDDSASEKSIVAPLIKAHGEDTTEIEKKNTQIAWEKARMSQAFNLTVRDAAAITAITIVAIVVRLWRISWPDEVVEVDVGRLVNRYFTGEYAFDVHPPLGTMIMAGVAALLNYNGTFEFDKVGDLYPSSMPYISMRLAVSLLGAFCAPIAYVTLKSSGQSALAAILASFMIVFDNALVTSNRLLGQDATLMFFTAATFMFWTLFSKQCTRPFTLAWWSWLLATGISMTGAMSVKLIGSASVVAIGLFTFSSLASLIMDDSVSMMTWLKHFTARIVALVVIPVCLYIAIFQFHFDHQSYQPSNTSPQAEYDLALLSKPFRQTLILKSHQNTSDLNWSSVVYGSVVQIQNEGLSEVYLHSMHETTPAGSKQQQLGGYHYPDLNTHWIVIRADMEEDDKEEVPSRLQFLKDGDTIRLRHVPTRFCLHSHKVRSYSHKAESALFEVTAYGVHEYDGDENDWWFVETVDPISNENIPVSDTNNEVKALETAFRLKHSKMGCYLFDTSVELPAPWGKGRHEIACRPGAKINPRSIWRFTMNKHDYLPYDTPVAAYPRFTYWQKFLETHKLMWRNVPIVEQIPQPATVHPTRRPSGQAVIYAWTGHTWQISLIANPVVWGVSLAGLLSYLGFRIVFILREKRGYIERGLVKDLKKFHINYANTYFTGWAFSYLPFFLVRRPLSLHHYSPALYFSILITSSMIAGAFSFLPRKVRFGLLLALIFAIISAFSYISPITYGLFITREKCQSINTWASYVSRNNLDCTTFSITPSRTPRFSQLRLKQRAKKEMLHKQYGHSKTTAATIPQVTEVLSSNSTFSSITLSEDLSEDRQPMIALPESGREPPPVLPLNLPPVDYPLPMQHLVLVGPQIPPQKRDYSVFSKS